MKSLILAYPHILIAPHPHPSSPYSHPSPAVGPGTGWGTEGGAGGVAEPRARARPAGPQQWVAAPGGGGCGILHGRGENKCPGREEEENDIPARKYAHLDAHKDACMTGAGGHLADFTGDEM